MTSPRLVLLAVLLAVSVVPALAQMQPMPMSQCPCSAGMCAPMQACTQQQSVKVEALNGKLMTLPLVMPVRVDASTGCMKMTTLSAGETMPTDAVAIPMSVPVQIISAAGSSCLSVKLDPAFSKAVLMMPCSSGANTIMNPVQLRQDHDQMIVCPTSVTETAGPVRVPVYVDGVLNLIPLSITTTAAGCSYSPTVSQEQIDTWFR